MMKQIKEISDFYNLNSNDNKAKNSSEPNYELILSTIPIVEIEKYLRKMKLNNLNKK